MEFFRIKRDIPFMRHALTFNVISLVTFLLAIAFLAFRGLNFGIHVVVTAPRYVDVRSNLREDGFPTLDIARRMARAGKGRAVQRAAQKERPAVDHQLAAFTRELAQAKAGGSSFAVRQGGPELVQDGSELVPERRVRPKRERRPSRPLSVAKGNCGEPLDGPVPSAAYLCSASCQGGCDRVVSVGFVIGSAAPNCGWR